MASRAIAGMSRQNRVHYRQKLRALAHIKLDSGNGGVVRDISESGMAVQLISRLPADEVVRFQLELPNPRVRFEAEGRVAWSDSLGQAGLVFVNAGSRFRELLKEWLFTQILADAQRVAGSDAAELLFSSAVRPVIRLEPGPARLLHSAPSASVRLLWFDVGAPRFSRLVDSIALLCAVLLFSLLALFLTDVLPSWPLTVAFVFAAAAVFALLYWAVFALWFGVTPGNRLAQLAAVDSRKEANRPKVRVPRFR
jgi:hypothetical protein